MTFFNFSWKVCLTSWLKDFVPQKFSTFFSFLFFLCLQNFFLFFFSFLLCSFPSLTTPPLSLFFLSYPFFQRLQNTFLFVIRSTYNFFSSHKLFVIQHNAWTVQIFFCSSCSQFHWRTSKIENINKLFQIFLIKFLLKKIKEEVPWCLNYFCLS